MKKKLIIIIIVVAIVLVIAGIAIYLSVQLNRLKKLQNLSSDEMIQVDLENNSEGIISIAIIKNGDIQYYVYKENAMQEEKLDYDYEIGSISKTFVGLMISKAVQEGKININDSISKYLDLGNDKYYPTIERLLTHTSGYKSYYFNNQMFKNQFNQDNDFYGITRDEIFNKVKSIDLKNQDYAYKYSNFGISVLGLILEKVYNDDFTSLMNNYIRNDLELSNTNVAVCNGNLDNYWAWKENDGYIPAGAIISNIESMAKYLNMYLTSNDEVVTNTYKVLKTINATDKTYEQLDIRMDQAGMTWMIDNINDIIWHNGATSNFNSYIGFDKNRQYGVVVLSNLSPNKDIPSTVIGPKIIMEIKEGIK